MMKNGCRIGGEQSGHIIFSKYATTGDGILTSLKIMEVMLEKKETLSRLASEVTILPQVLKNVRVADKAAALGIDCQVTVEADGEEEWPIPQSVTVMGSLTAEQQEALERTIEEDFAIPAERQRYESGDEG